MFSKSLVLFSALMASVGAQTLKSNIHDDHYYEAKFYDWVSEHSISFDSGEEFVQRLKIFADTDDAIELHNKKDASSFKKGHNKWSHLTPDEWRETVGVGPKFAAKFQDNMDSYSELATATLRDDNADDVNPPPLAVDWVTAGAVTPVKNQGSCGSCWTFSVTGALEGGWAIKNGRTEALSEQMIVDCSGNQDSCDGGQTIDALNWVKDNKGLCSEADYAYVSGESVKQNTCAKDNCTVVPNSYASDFGQIQSNDEDALKAALAVGPVSVLIEADEDIFMNYASGVITAGCGNKIDHAVLAVGYGSEFGTDYWLVKNSWGTVWGEEGYFKIQRGLTYYEKLFPEKYTVPIIENGACGILTFPLLPIVMG